MGISSLTGRIGNLLAPFTSLVVNVWFNKKHIGLWTDWTSWNVLCMLLVAVVWTLSGGTAIC